MWEVNAESDTAGSVVCFLRLQEKNVWVQGSRAWTVPLERLLKEVPTKISSLNPWRTNSEMCKGCLKRQVCSQYQQILICVRTCCFSAACQGTVRSFWHVLLLSCSCISWMSLNFRGVISRTNSKAINFQLSGFNVNFCQNSSRPHLPV